MLNKQRAQDNGYIQTGKDKMVKNFALLNNLLEKCTEVTDAHWGMDQVFKPYNHHRKLYTACKIIRQVCTVNQSLTGHF